MTEEIREKFRQLKLCGERNNMAFSDKKSADLAVIDYMNQLLDCGELCETEDICFAFWNISDSYAMQRNIDDLYNNHKKFKDFISCIEEKYKYYLVCDTTQRFTLISGGYSDFWNELYRDAVENAAVTDENYRIVYEAHRAALGVHKQLDIPVAHLQYAIEKFSEFLDNCKGKEEYDFFKLIYESSYIKAFSTVNIGIERLCTIFYEYLNTSDDKTPYVIGEWNHFNRLRSSRNRAVVGITAAINALIDTGEIARALKLYDTAKQYGLPKNSYVNKRLSII